MTYAREQAGLTKRALAEQCGISEQLMGEIESGRRNATPLTLRKLAQALNCPRVVLEAKRASGDEATQAELATVEVAAPSPF